MSGFTNLGDLVRRDRDLSKIAVIDLGGEESPREFTYAQLDAMANGVARALASRGYGRGDRIAILSANRAEYLAAYYGILRAGLVAVPVNFKFPRATIQFILQDSGAKLVFCDAVRLADCPDGLPVVLFGGQQPSAGAAKSDVATAVRFDDFLDPGAFEAIVPAQGEPAMFLYTSGSTGTPKGVVLSHQSHIWVVETRLAPGLDRHRFLIAAPLYHMNALALSQARLRRARHHRAAAAVHRPRLYRGDRALPRDLAHRRAADDRHDAAGEGVARPHRSLQRGVHPHGLGAGEPEPDAGDPRDAAARRR